MDHQEHQYRQEHQDRQEHQQKFYNIIRILNTYKPYRLTCRECNITKIAPVLYSFSIEEFICSKKCFENL
jgi:hypothetical protein